MLLIAISISCLVLLASVMLLEKQDRTMTKTARTVRKRNFLRIVAYLRIFGGLVAALHGRQERHDLILVPVSYTHLDVYKRQLNISPSQQNYITNSNAGEGLIFYGSTIVPFKDDFPKDTKLYRIMTTKPDVYKRQA